jgi:AraC family transcriptional regulator of adaptative response/methylated-DNA-[protein]-cysteine methyltransferase
MHAPQQQLYYSRIADAIAYINTNHASQPTLGQMAAAVHMSPFHFQRVFARWAGVSPKKFLQFISLKQAQQALQRPAATLFDAAIEAGLSGTGRLHDLFVQLEGMTPGDYKNGGANLEIKYSFSETPFGEVLIASTSVGICHLAFCVDTREAALAQLRLSFPNAGFLHHAVPQHAAAISVFGVGREPLSTIKLHVKGTAFQLKVWEALLKIPSAKLTSYGAVAKSIAKPQAARAVGTAIGSNPVAYLIPCHRVIQSTGIFGDYMWGSGLKTAIIGWEAAQLQGQPGY